MCGSTGSRVRVCLAVPFYFNRRLSRSISARAVASRCSAASSSARSCAFSTLACFSPARACTSAARPLVRAADPCTVLHRQDGAATEPRAGIPQDHPSAFAVTTKIALPRIVFLTAMRDGRQDAQSGVIRRAAPGRDFITGAEAATAQAARRIHLADRNARRFHHQHQPLYRQRDARRESEPIPLRHHDNALRGHRKTLLILLAVEADALLRRNPHVFLDDAGA